MGLRQSSRAEFFRLQLRGNCAQSRRMYRLRQLCALEADFISEKRRKAITKGVVRLAPLRAGIENREGEAENEGEYPIERIPRDD